MPRIKDELLSLHNDRLRPPVERERRSAASTVDMQVPSHASELKSKVRAAPNTPPHGA